MSIEQAENNYKTNPTEQNYLQLLSSAEKAPEYSVSSFLLKLQSSFTGSKETYYKHLANAFAIARRYSEGNHFCGLWCIEAPASIDCWRLSGIIAAYRGDIEALQNAIRRLNELNAPDHIQWSVLSLRALVFNNGNDADLFAEQMLRTGGADAFCYQVALDVAMRTESVDLIWKVLHDGQRCVSLSKYGEKRIRNILLERLVRAIGAKK